MADLELTVTIKDINVSKVAAAFLRKCPMPQIPDPEESAPIPMIDKYPNTKTWAQVWLRRNLLRAVNHGIKELATDASTALTDDIFL